MKVEIDEIAWEMAVWEAHRLRTEWHTVLLLIAVHASSHPDAGYLVDLLNEAKKRFDADHLRALRDPALRKLMPADI